MCLLYFHWQPDSAYPLRLAANRDEWLNRPSQAMLWRNLAAGVQVLCGLDEQAGGTWLAFDWFGRFAALTNVRSASSASNESQGLRSRGELVLGFLQQPGSMQAFANQVLQNSTQYGPFNLLLGDIRGVHSDAGLLHIFSPTQQVAKIAPGGHVISNASLDTPWPKALRLRAALEPHTADTDEIWSQGARQALQNNQRFASELLPHTGVSAQMESYLSSEFVSAPGYGTRCSTVASYSQSGLCKVQEISYQHADAKQVVGEEAFVFQCQNSPTT